MSDSQTPTLHGVIGDAITTRLYGVRVMLPGRIESYDKAKQRASVQPLVMDAKRDEADKRVTDPLPVINNVPVQFFGSGRRRWTVPVAVGDTVTLIFASSSIARWLANGGHVEELEDVRHDINHAVAFPGLHDFGHVPTDAPDDAMVCHSDIPIKLGGTAAADEVARKSDLEAINTALTVAIAALATSPVAAAALTALQTALNNLFFPVCSSKVFVE